VRRKDGPGGIQRVHRGTASSAEGVAVGGTRSIASAVRRVIVLKSKVSAKVNKGAWR
jgi:hypothetical protein